MFKLRRLIFIIPIIVMVVIFMFSAQPGVKSKNTSSVIVKKVVTSIAKLNKKIDVEKTSKNLHTFVRKLAHYALFLLLGGSLLLSIDMNFFTTLKNKILYSSTIGLLYAVSDEFHQTFVKGRSGEILDVGIDFLGVCSGIFIIYLLKKIFKSNSCT